MSDEIEEALAHLIEAVARIPAKRIPDRADRERRSTEDVSHPPAAGTTGAHDLSSARLFDV
jgi:hypothetical protein